MRLINTTSLKFREFIGRNIPPYAILSHTWGDEEVAFKDWGTDKAPEMKGYSKIEKTCALAKLRGIEWAWVDTCCIDKSSSAELTEAINSMYDWYGQSVVCFVYLSDLLVQNNKVSRSDFKKCRWFTRGWTLQELIAPKNLEYYDCNWESRGGKSESGLCLKWMSEITSIPTEILNHKAPLSSVCVAAKMSWAASRETTRTEDLAYCLLGIFGVNLPLLYGEQERAFLRLQEEIIRTTYDLTVLAWNPTEAYDPDPTSFYMGFLATSPKPFATFGDFVPFKSNGHVLGEFATSNRGIRLQVEQLWRDDSGYLLPLGRSREQAMVSAIPVRLCGPRTFVRKKSALTVPTKMKIDRMNNVKVCLLTRAAISGPQLTTARTPTGVYGAGSVVTNGRSSAIKLVLDDRLAAEACRISWSALDRFDVEEGVMIDTGLEDSWAAAIITFQPSRPRPVRMLLTIFWVNKGGELPRWQVWGPQKERKSRQIWDVAMNSDAWDCSGAVVLARIETIAGARLGSEQADPKHVIQTGPHEFLGLSYSVRQGSNKNICAGPIWELHLSHQTIDRGEKDRWMASGAREL